MRNGRSRIKITIEKPGDLILRSGLLAASRRMDGEKNGVAAILRDARRSALLRMRA
jgi:hypothetical protein